MKNQCILAIVTGLLLCGCGVGKPVLVGDRVEIRKLIQARRADMGFPVHVTPTVAASQSRLRQVEGQVVTRGNVGKLTIDRAIISLFREFGLFPEVASHRRGMDEYFIIDSQVAEYLIAYKGRNGAHIPNLIWWWFSPWASWLVADENYSASLSVIVRVRDARTGAQIWNGTVKTEVVKALDDYQRGTKWFSIFGIGRLKPENWKLVEETLRPHVLEEFKAGLLRQLLSAGAQKALTERAGVIEYRRRPLRNVAIVASVDSSPLLDGKQPKWCNRSAGKTAEVLKKRGYENVVLLKDPRLSEISAAIRNAGESKDYRIGRLLFYYAGAGATEYDEERGSAMQFVLDCDGKKLSLVDLIKQIESVKAQRRAVILDAGFITDDLGRGISLNTIPENAVLEFPGEAVSGRCAFLSACSPSQGAAEDGDLKACLFSSYLLKALSSPTCDANRDGLISLQELAESEPVRFDLSRHSRLRFGISQSPFLGPACRQDNFFSGGK